MAALLIAFLWSKWGDSQSDFQKAKSWTDLQVSFSR